MKIILIFFCVFAAFSETFSQSDYCQISCSIDGRMMKNIGCSKENGGSCPPNAKIVSIKGDLQNLVVELHNKHRNFIAGGGDRNHERACRMATMKWNDELAYLASLHVKSCNFKHDDCHDTKQFFNSGQNIYIYYTTNPNGFDDREQIEKGIYSWFAEVSLSKQAFIDAYPRNGPKIGHFTVMMHENNTHVGCAAIVFTTDKNYYMLTCNYATTNYYTLPIYNTCRTSAPCASRNPAYPNLCA